MSYALFRRVPTSVGTPPDAVMEAPNPFSAADQFMTAYALEECFIARSPEYFTQYVWGRTGRARRIADMIRPT